MAKLYFKNSLQVVGLVIGCGMQAISHNFEEEHYVIIMYYKLSRNYSYEAFLIDCSIFFFNASDSTFMSLIRF